MRRIAPVVLVALALTVVAGCSSDDGSDTTAAGTNADGRDDAASGTATTIADAPAGDAFYTPPDPLPAGEPGDIIWAATVAPPAGTTGIDAWRILYRSTTVDGDPIAVSALLFAPTARPAGEPTPILAYAHGTTGLGDQCAPSKLYADDPRGSGEAAGLTDEMLGEYVVVATDYEGLGTPGVHPYVVGLSEGRNVLDSIRAAQRFPDIGTTSASESVVWGHSQGGGAALLTAELASTYAPDANLVGAAAGAPASELKLLATALRTSPFFGYIFMAGAGFHAAYPDVELATVLTPEGLAAVERAGTSCSGEIVADYQGKDPDLYLKADPGTTEPIASILEENSPGVRATDVPILLYHGESDEQIPVVASQLVLARYCENGTTAYRRTYPGATHTSVIPMAIGDIRSYLADRLAGEPAPTSC